MLQHDTNDPFDLIHPNGGMVDVWIMDDQAVICDPKLIHPTIDAVDNACQHPQRSGVRNRIESHVILTPHPKNTNSTNKNGTWICYEARPL